jgi:Flp pilus assembly protein TadB
MSCAKLSGVPLSEDEQRILSEIEERLYESDPRLAREVSSNTIYSHTMRNIRRAALLFLLGTVVMVALLSTSPFLAFLGVILMFLAAVWAVQNARHMGRAGWNEITTSMRSGHMKDFFGGQSDRMRERFRRED